MRKRSRGSRALAGLRSLRVRALLSLGVVLVLGCAGTFAYWSDTAVVSGTTISTGTLDIKVNNADSVSTFTSMNITNMVPGNTTAGVLTIKNAGTAPFTYSMGAVATNTDGKGLGAALVAKVTGDSTVSGTTPAVKCAGAALANTGTAFAANLISAASPRSLAVGASETICLQATLPTTAASSLQGGTTNITFTFTANQLQ